jgi:septal ring factor EnvC (AmiA/AmiB activator)
MDKQALLDYLNSELVQYDNQIDQEKKMKENIDQSIEQQNQTIEQLKKQKEVCDQNIITYEQDKVYVNELIIIVENS